MDSLWGGDWWVHQETEYGSLGQKQIILFPKPSNSSTSSRDDTQPTSEPKRYRQGRCSIDSVPPSLPLLLTLLSRSRDIRRSQLQPFCPAPDDMRDTDGDQTRKRDVTQDRRACEAMRDVFQSDVGRTAFEPQWRDSIRKRMA